MVKSIRNNKRLRKTHPYKRVSRNPRSLSNIDLDVPNENSIIVADLIYGDDDVSSAMSVDQSSTESSWHQELGVSGLENTIKWHTLKHNGPKFAPPYVRLPPNVKFYYNSRPVDLSESAEEAATLYANLLDTDLAKNPLFQFNFFSCFIRLLRPRERKIIQKFSLCNFEQIHDHYQHGAELKTRRSKEQQMQLKQQRHEEMEHFGYCEIDGQREQIANYHIEPPGIFRGRGNHPMIGMFKLRVQPEDITINCSVGCTPAAPEGHSWRKTLHNNRVSWLARWKDSTMLKQKYIWLSSASRLEGIRDLNKFQMARRLSFHIHMIRQSYRNDWHAEDLRMRQRGVALYLIDRLMLRVGNEKQENTADTEGCCTLRVEHLKLYNHLKGVPHVVIFNFLGKDSVKFYRKVALHPTVFANLRYFMKGKRSIDLVFDLLLAKYLNKHLKKLMEGLTAKVFRTYNASKMLQKRLDDLTLPSQTLNEKLHVYTKANATAAQFCNHRRTLTKANSRKLLNWQKLIEAKHVEIVHFKKRCRIKRHIHSGIQNKKNLRMLESELIHLKEKLEKESMRSNIALTTSKVNYLDPRITVAWCKRNDVPIEKVFSHMLQKKFKWAIRATNEDFRF